MFVFFLCLILASVQKVIRMLRDCLSSSLAIHFISLQLPLERQKVKTSRWLSVLQPDCFFFFFFCLLYSRIFPSDCCFGEFASSNLPLSFGLLPSLSHQLLLWSKKKCKELKLIQSLPVQAHLTSRNHSLLQASALLSLTRLILMMLNL